MSDPQSPFQQPGGQSAAPGTPAPVACPNCGYARTPPGKSRCYNCGQPLYGQVPAPGPGVTPPAAQQQTRAAPTPGPAAVKCPHCGYARTPPGKPRCYNCGQPLFAQPVLSAQVASQPRAPQLPGPAAGRGQLPAVYTPVPTQQIPPASPPPFLQAPSSAPTAPPPAGQQQPVAPALAAAAPAASAEPKAVTCPACGHTFVP